MNKKEFRSKYSANNLKNQGITGPAARRAAALKKMFLSCYDTTPAGFIGYYKEYNGRRLYCNNIAAFSLDPINCGYHTAPEYYNRAYNNVIRLFDTARNASGRYIDITRDDVKRGTVQDAAGRAMFFIDASEDNMLLYARVNPDYLLNAFDILQRDLLRVHISGGIDPLYIVNSAGESALLCGVRSDYNSYCYYKNMLAARFAA